MTLLAWGLEPSPSGVPSRLGVRAKPRRPTGLYRHTRACKVEVQRYYYDYYYYWWSPRTGVTGLPVWHLRSLTPSRLTSQLERGAEDRRMQKWGESCMFLKFITRKGVSQSDGSKPAAHMPTTPYSWREPRERGHKIFACHPPLTVVNGRHS